MVEIAILDDNYDFCLAMDYLLSNYFEVSSFTDTDTFLKEIESGKYDLGLIDLSIIPTTGTEIQNGCELIEYLKEHLKSPPALILFTGWLGRNDLEEGRKMCPLADGFLSKGSDFDEILQEINRFLTSKVHKT